MSLPTEKDMKSLGLARIALICIAGIMIGMGWKESGRFLLGICLGSAIQQLIMR